MKPVPKGGRMCLNEEKHSTSDEQAEISAVPNGTGAHDSPTAAGRFAGATQHSAVTDADQAYHDQIQQWMRQSGPIAGDSGDTLNADAAQAEQTSTNRTTAGEPQTPWRTSRGENSPTQKPKGKSIANVLSTMSFRSRSVRVLQDLPCPQHDARSLSKGKESWQKIRTLVRQGRFASAAAGHCKQGSGRVRGHPLDKPLREVTKQRDIVTAQEGDPTDGIQPSWLPPGSGSNYDEEDMFARVEAIVDKARDYSGCKSSRRFAQEHSLTRFLPYAKVAGLVLLATVDLVLALNFHVFWTNSDFLCEYHEDSPGQVRLVQVALLATVAGLHFLRTVSKVLATDESGELVGLRYFHSRELFDYSGVCMNNVDFCLNAASCAVLAKHANDCEWERDSLYHVVVRRLHAHLHLIRSLIAFQACFSMNLYLRQQLQVAASGNRRRFIHPKSKLNLDLTHVCDRLIGMAMPCVDKTDRNDIRDVARFFAVFHYGTFLVYNLCEGHEEQGNGNYDTALLYGQVQHVGCREHNVPRFRCIVKFCETSTDWLNAGDKNVVAVHSQEGTGRTGTFCAALMLFCGYSESAKKALHTFALRRTAGMHSDEALQGVSSPSQIRYVHYMEAYVFEGVNYHAHNYRVLHQISLGNMKQAAMKHCALSFIVEVDGAVQYDHAKEAGLLSWEACDKCSFMFPTGNVVLAGDVTVRFFLFDELEAEDYMRTTNNSVSRGVVGEGGTTIKYGRLTGKQHMFVSFHTAFHRGSLFFHKNEVDGACWLPKEQCGENFHITLHIRDLNEGLKVCLDDAPRVHKPARPCASGLEELLPRKVNNSMEMLRTHARLHEVFKQACPSTTSFDAGDLMFQDRVPGHISLHYIAQGVVSTRQRGQKLATTVQSTKDVFDGEEHGVGHVLMRGMEQDLRPVDYFAGRHGASTRVIALPLSPDGYLPLEAACLDQRQLAQLYSCLAHQESAKSRKYRDKISAMNKKQATMLKAQLIGNGGNQQRKVLSNLIHRFGIADTEMLLGGSHADVEKEDGSFEAGCVFAVSNWVLFSPESTVWSRQKRSEVVIRMHDISMVDARGSTLTLHVEDVRDSRDRHSLGNVADSDHCSGSVLSSGNSSGQHMSTPPSLGKKRAKAGVHRAAKRNDLMQKRLQQGLVLLRFPDEEACDALAQSIQARVLELSDTHSRQQCDMSALKFGYILPAEVDDEGGQSFLQHLLNISEVRTYAPGEEIIGKQHERRSLYHIISGTATCYSNDKLNMEDIGPGEIVGESSFLSYNSGFAETMQVVASTEVKCFVSPAEQAQTLCSLHSNLAVRFYRGLALSCIIRNRRFRRLYQQNLKRAGEEGDMEHRLSPLASRSRPGRGKLPSPSASPLGSTHSLQDAAANVPVDDPSRSVPNSPLRGFFAWAGSGNTLLPRNGSANNVLGSARNLLPRDGSGRNLLPRNGSAKNIYGELQQDTCSAGRRSSVGYRHSHWRSANNVLVERDARSLSPVRQSRSDDARGRPAISTRRNIPPCSESAFLDLGGSTRSLAERAVQRTMSNGGSIDDALSARPSSASLDTETEHEAHGSQVRPCAATIRLSV